MNTPQTPDRYYHLPLRGLDIYGERILPDAVLYVGDRAAIERYERQGLIFARWYSEACVDGEIGTNPGAGCQPISQRAFEHARACGWTLDHAPAA